MTDAPAKKKAGIVVDVWKLPIFERILRKAGYKWVQLPGSITTGALTLVVETNNLQALAQVVLRANQEAAKERRKQP